MGKKCHVMHLKFGLLAALAALARASLLVDYTGGEDTDLLGSCQLEGQNLGDSIKCPGNSSISIQPGKDPGEKQALVYHRDSHFRRAEVKAGSEEMWKAETEYYVGYDFMITNQRKSLVLFQWKRDDKAVEPQDNIPFHLEFLNDQLNLQVTTPGESGSDRNTVAKAKFSSNEEHRIALTFDTKMNGGDVVSQGNRLAWWLDGKKIFDQAEYSLWSTKTGTHPKFGIYRGEAAVSVPTSTLPGAHILTPSSGEGADDEAAYTFDSYVYRVQVSDAGFDEIGDSSGVTGAS